MQTLLAAVTILVLASVAKDQVAHAVTGWEPFSRVTSSD
jgi:hypothetical protein